MYYKITPYQLMIYLQMAIKYAEKSNCDLPKAELLCKELQKVNWDDDAELVIMEKPF